MKRSTKLALSLVLAVGMTAPAFAQDQFPDVPANHWAYEALARMKRDGLLVGYPDGLFRGGRPASRYELAVAMHAVSVGSQSRSPTHSPKSGSSIQRRLPFENVKWTPLESWCSPVDL